MGPDQHKTRTILGHGAVALGLAAIAGTGLWWALGQRPDWQHGLGCWLVAVNVVAFGTSSYDTATPATGPSRVPGPVLHLLTVVGGGLGSFAASHWFRHQAARSEFHILLWAMAALQAALILWLIWLMW